MSADGTRISFVSSKGRELGQYMATTLDEEWRRARGMEIQAVGIASISYDEDSMKLINMRNEGAMLGDPNVRQGYVQGAMARGMEAAGSNANGALAGFMGMGMGMNAGGNFMGAASAANMQQMQMQQPYGQPQVQPQQAPAPAPAMAGAASSPQAGAAAPGEWVCSCGNVNHGKFCSECGSPKPAPAGPWTCSCGTVNNGKFCSECGRPRD